MRQLVEEQKVPAADEYLADLKEKSPSAYESPEVQKLAADLQILKDKVKGLKLKVADRMTSEGKVATLTAPDGKSAVMIEVQCESSPVAKSEDFVFLCDQLTKQLMNGPGAATPDELLSQNCPDKPAMTLRELHEDILNRIRENIVVARAIKIAGPVAGYTHHDGTLGVLFQASGENATSPVLRDVAMHIASMNPTVCLPEQLDPARTKERAASCGLRTASRQTGGRGRTRAQTSR